MGAGDGPAATWSTGACRTARAWRRMMALARLRKRRRRRGRRRTTSEFHQDNCHGKTDGARASGRRLVTASVGFRLALISLWLLAGALLLQPGPSASISAPPTAALRGGQEVEEGLSLEENGQQQQQQGRSKSGRHQEYLSREQLDRIRAESRLEAAVGQNAVLNCAVQFRDGHEKPFAFQWVKYPNKLPIYIWYAGYPPHVAAGYEGRVQRLGQASLNLSRLAPSDMGLYECRIYYQDKRPDERGNSTWIFLDVQAPPHFTQVPAPISYVQAGDSLQLGCQAESTPAPHLRWYKDKTPLEAGDLPPAHRLAAVGPPESANEQPSAGPQRSRLDLILEQVEPGAQTGDYRCVASNSEGSVEARAQVMLALPAVISGLPRNQSRQEGQQAEFECQAKGLPNNITYRWLFNGQPLQQLKWFEARHSVRRDGSLLIHSVHRDDQGEFRCQASNGLAHRAAPGSGAPAAPLYAEAAAQLEVEFMARVISSPSPQYLPLGLSGLIRCHSQARPPAHLFMWTRNDRFFDHNLDQNIEQLANGSLLVRQVTRNYEGLYRCTPHNKLGSAGSSGAMEVRVEEPPAFTQRPADFYKAPANGSVDMACEARGRPQPSVSWRRLLVGASESTEASQQQSVIYDKLPSDRSEHKSGHLLLRQLRKEDHGRYECVVENEVATLVASTQLYVDDTTPHAPTNLRVEPKSWSAQLSWEPGYDGGYEQTFTVWYRQLSAPKQQVQKWASRLPVPVTQAPSLAPAGTVEQREPLELEWRSLPVPAAGPTTSTATFTVHNLTQDAGYEFYVRPRNYLGDGPRSQLVEAHTKRAISGQLTPVAQWPQAEASAEASSQQVFEADVRPTPGNDDDDDNADDAESQGGGPRLPMLQNGPTVMGIIHLVDVTTSDPQAPDDQQASKNKSDSNTASASTPTAPAEPTNSSTNKVIRIYLPSGQQQQQQQLGSKANSSAEAAANEAPHSKRFDASNSSSLELPVQLDSATAPHNLTVTKVAQGWVLNWWPPRRLQESAGGQQLATSEHLRASGASPERAAYAVEYRERQGGWLALPETLERNLLVKDLKPGAEYTFRVFALNQLGQRGASSPELRYAIPDNRRKPGSAQALSAGVVSGILFFIACIVIAVCLVNMCNRRRKRRAEKAAYVMMACPVLESHHSDLAALNSNSLLKNPASDRPSGRVSGLVGGAGHHLAALLGSFRLRMSAAAESKLEPQRQIRYTSNAPVPVDVPATAAQTPSATPLDDYWLHRPQADRKWGTLTVAASRLAERRAQLAELRQIRTAAEVAPEVDSLADELGRNLADHLPGPGAGRANKSGLIVEGGANQSGSRTLPRWFGGVPATNQWPLARLDSGDNNNSQLQNQSRQQQFSCWLRDQLGGVSAAAAVGWPQVPAFHQQQRPHHYQLQPPPPPPLHQLHQRSFSQVAATTAATAAATVLASGQLACQQQQSLMVARNSPHRRTLPLALGGQAHWQPQINNKSPGAAAYLATAAGELEGGQLGDAVDAKNACLGSYKRKRRLPHIEAQFTIRTPPELPVRRQLHHHQLERVALQNGHLFVRSLADDGGALDHDPHHGRAHRPPPPPPLPPGMPRDGQRREWRRSRPGPPLSQVATIGAREKIETYLRHYERHRSEEADEASDADEPLQVDKLEQLTFQPYHNLPSLKYTITLPLSQRSDGTLLLNETSHLRRSTRRGSGPEEMGGHRRQNRPKTRRLGSSSSCPAPPADFSSFRRDLELSRRSLTDCGTPLIAVATNLDRLACAGHRPQPDSLEKVDDAAAEATPGGGLDNEPANLGGPFYLRTPPADGESVSARLRDALLLGLPPPPPPVPPHRTSNDAQVQTEEVDEGAKMQEATNSSDSSNNSPTGGESNSEAPTNSVDENYEFDLISSCSSNRNKPRQTISTTSKLDSPARRQVNNDLYTQVSKKKSPKNELQVKERSHFYDYSSRRKEQPLTGAAAPQKRQTESDSTSDEATRGATTSQENSLDYYDTVYEGETNSRQT